jgi:hypothetical protein
MYVVAGLKRLAVKEDTRPVFKLIASRTVGIAPVYPKRSDMMARF